MASETQDQSNGRP